MHTTAYTWLKRCCLAVSFFSGLLAWTGCSKDDDSNDRPYTISGEATGAQVVPPVATTASGTITGTYNPQTNLLTFSSNWVDLSGPPTGADIYIGAAGVSGVSLGDPWEFAAWPSESGNVTGTTELTEDQENQLLNGQLYYSYSTGSFPGGEIRGQIHAVR